MHCIATIVTLCSVVLLYGRLQRQMQNPAHLRAHRSGVRSCILFFIRSQRSLMIVYTRYQNKKTLFHVSLHKAAAWLLITNRFVYNYLRRGPKADCGIEICISSKLYEEIKHQIRLQIVVAFECKLLNSLISSKLLYKSQNYWVFGFCPSSGF
jgi:hypothetical protein